MPQRHDPHSGQFMGGGGSGHSVHAPIHHGATHGDAHTSAHGPGSHISAEQRAKSAAALAKADKAHEKRTTAARNKASADHHARMTGGTPSVSERPAGTRSSLHRRGT